MRVYSCYFSSGDPFEVFETQILLLEEILSEAVGRSLIGGDFNSKSPKWGETRLNRRGILVGEMVARNDLIVLNQNKETRSGGGGGQYNQPHDCRASSRLKGRRLVGSQGDNLE